MSKKSSKRNNEQNTKTCTKCLKAKKPSKDFYMSYSIAHADGRVPICKQCIAEIAGDDYRDIQTALRMVDKPWIPYLWESALADKRETIGAYFVLINAKDFRNKTWADSEDEKVSDNIISDNVTPASTGRTKDVFQITPEIVEKWGTGYDSEQYKKLENFYNDMKRSYEIETASHKDYLKKICKISLKMEEAIDQGHIDTFKKLSDAYDKLMHSAKFTAVQRSAADRTGGLNTFSEFFEFIEKEGFIPKFHTDEPMDIVDATINNLKEFTRRLVLGDPNISTIVEEAISKINDKEEEPDYEEMYIDLEENEVDE